MAPPRPTPARALLVCCLLLFIFGPACLAAASSATAADAASELDAALAEFSEDSVGDAADTASSTSSSSSSSVSSSSSSSSAADASGSAALIETYASASVAAHKHAQPPTPVPHHVAIDLQSSRHCLGWRNTNGCTYTGHREPLKDLTCDATVDEHHSGYCLCAGGVRTAESKCGHWPLNCAAECAKVPGFRAAWHLPPPPPVEDVSVPFCIGWRNTAGCTPDGPREPHLDATCYAEVPKRRSGYCLCAGGLQAAFHGCEERPVFTCAAVCAKLPKPTAAPRASASGRGNAWARLAKRAQTPAARQAAARIAVAQMKRRAAAKVAAAYAKREHAAKVALADKLLGHEIKTAAEAKANIKAMRKATAPEVEWYRRRFEISAARLMAKRGGWWSEKQTLEFFKDFRKKMADEAAKNAKQQNAADEKKFAAIPAELKALEAKRAAKKAARAEKMRKMSERAIAAAQASSEAN